MFSADARTILVAIAEPLERSQPVLERAAALAEALEGELILFHAAFDPALSGRPLFDSARLARSRGAYVEERSFALERRAIRLRRDGTDTRVRVVWEEPAHEAIVRAALRHGANLVVAGPHRNERRGAPLRFTDWELLRLCPQPLWLIRGREPQRGPIVVALDPTHAADKPASLDAALLAHADVLARALEVELHAVHCIPRSAYPLGETSAAGRKRMHTRMRARIHRLTKKTGIAVDKVHVLEGPAAQLLPQLAGKLRAHVLVMGAISRRGLKRFAMGNTAESVIDQARCDLLVIKPEGFTPKLGRLRKEALVAPSA